MPVSAQVDSLIGQISSSSSLSFSGGISGNGRFVVIESSGDIATENPRNTDGNREIFLFDYAQRRIFQITDTKPLLTDPTMAITFSNIKVDILNIRPVISNDGRWIAFGSNATTSRPGMVNTTNPGSFDANSFTGAMGANVLTTDGNSEMWLYQIPAAPAADLTTGEEIPFVNLNGGTFTQVTNTLPSRLPTPGSPTRFPVIADDNSAATINNNGSIIAFISNRDLVPCTTTPTATCGNAFPDFDNDEVYTYVRTPGTLKQVTATQRGTVGAPIYNANPTISGAGTRVTFISNAENAVVGMTGGSNADLNEEIYYTDLTAGSPSGTPRQITQTTRANPGNIVNILDIGRRMSRDGRYIAFDSFADLSATGTGTNLSSFALYLYDTVENTFQRVGPRSDADVNSLGDVPHYGGFTDNNAAGTPSTLVLTTRQNITSAGVVPANIEDGLNPDPTRPSQIYSYDFTVATPIFKRLTKFPPASGLPTLVQAVPSDVLNRMTFTHSLSELGTGNFDFLNESYYFLLPNVTTETPGSLNYATGASRLPVTVNPVPTPSPTATPTATPTPTPSTPPAVQGTSPGSLAIVNYTSGINQPLVPRTAVGSLDRRFTLPIQLSGVTMSINGVAVGLKSVSSREIIFVVPPGLLNLTTMFPVVINNNGVVIRGMITISPARPDIFNTNEFPSPNGRAKVFNATNRVLTTEPFTVTTFKFRGSRRVPTVLRLFMTGIQGVPASAFTIRVGDVQISGANILTDAIEVAPGVFTVDFQLPPGLNMAGDVPIVVTLMGGGLTFTSRLDDTAARVRIL